MLGIFKKLFDQNERELRRISAIVQRINALEPEIQRLSDDELRAKTAEFKERVARGESLDSILPEAFAVVREAARRTLGMRHFDVQLMGGVVLHEGNIAEMKTGEGKTLVATLPAYLNALEGRGVHIVTVNDYLAKRDSEWMGQVYKFLGLSVGLIVHGLDIAARQRAYAADITYGTNNEFGFDYLRDNMALRKEDIVQRELNYAIVDEVDSILIDEARTPLIISGMAEKPVDLYYKFARLAESLRRDEDYTVDEKAHTVALTEHGVARVEKMLGVENLFDHENMDLSHYLINALKAKELMKRDRDYIVKDGEVIIVDEFTGRLMIGRRYSDGLHQAIEAKEGLRIRRESQTLATITFQNYFKMYRKLAGMTGTAATEAEEFRKIYGLDVVVIPTNKPMIRVDYPDVVYKTERAKFRAIVEEICQCYQRGQPVLVGTVSIEKSEMLSEMLKKRGVPHQVLNAKYHEKEAEIVAQAGRSGSVTIATNMAGRGTDILLGGNPAFLARQRLKQDGYPEWVIAEAVEHGPVTDEKVREAREKYRQYYEEARKITDADHEKVVQLGGLHVIGTERHESRRIDNQLRGRSGRQGDPGSSRFYLSLEDDLMRLFGSDLIAGLMDRLGIDEDEPIEHPLLTRAIETAQKRVEARNFEIRRHVLEYDNVMNKQREVIYAERRQVLEGIDLTDKILKMVERVVSEAVDIYASDNVDPEEWDLRGLVEYLQGICLNSPCDPGGLVGLTRDQLKDKLLELAIRDYREREAQLGRELMQEFQRLVLLRVVDSKWVDHLDAMDDLREGIGLRAYGQKDPLLEYQIEAYNMFEEMVKSIQRETVRYVFKLNVVKKPEPVRRPAVLPQGTGAAGQPSDVGGKKKIGRNDPCPCGSGKKYKKCCGKLA